MAAAPTVLLPTGVYRPMPGQAAPAYAIRVWDAVTNQPALMSLEGRVVCFANEYRAADVLGWVGQHERVRMEIVPYQPCRSDLPSEEWERRQQGHYVAYSERCRLARLGLAGL